MRVIERFRELGADVSTLTDYDKMTIVPTGCHGFCEQGVLVIIPDKHVTYVKVKETGQVITLYPKAIKESIAEVDASGMYVTNSFSIDSFVFATSWHLVL